MFQSAGFTARPPDVVIQESDIVYLLYKENNS